MTDRDVVEKKRAMQKNGDKFKSLYSGADLQNNHSNSDMSLMNILAYWCNGDKEQMLRIFRDKRFVQTEQICRLLRMYGNQSIARNACENNLYSDTA
ncbi:MAG: hypothetical protein L6V85_08250 [Clostridiales bacterium]|nr:MAG: hypothetical protein L6V85_08250 [Clostridiales bacterium]